MSTVWWLVLLVSSFMLLLLLLRNKATFRWLGGLGIHIITAFVLLYATQLLSAYTSFELPMNLTTVGTVGILGVPGLFLLIALKLTLV